ncbi:O-methyltransferase [Confluentibacter sediminis]|uniref:O-methyltransferase n=1 Tax=Confluentibacter sediminis TaxID=2219045 RepID=UPI000DACE5B5|nr:class I SAM-dependent methyltransferase [Confluentibacter sediminis]
MTHQIKSYIKFIFKSTNQHGVHSPFVFNLVTKCFYDKQDYEAYKQILNYKKNVLKNRTKIRVTDLDVGSQATNNTEYFISEIAKNARTTHKRAKLLYRLANYFKFENILELGTSLGIATHAISLANPNVNIITIEGCQDILEFNKNNFREHDLEKVHLIAGDFKHGIKGLTPMTFDLIFFDVNAQKDAALDYFESLIKTIHNDSVFIFDNIYGSESMTEAWEIIKQHPKVTVTIDVFFWGFVFFRKEQVKENFIIRC